MTLLNFPPTNGQPTDGSFTYTANGVIYAWDGEKWTANSEQGLDGNFVNIDGDTMTGDLQVPNLISEGDVQTTSLNGGPLAGLRNQLINGDFRIWQRGTTATSAGTGHYTADRWKETGGVAGATVSRSTTAPAGFAYSAQLDSNTGDFQQGIELNAVGSNGQFAIGTTWTFSVWANKDITSQSPNCRFRKGVAIGIDQVEAGSFTNWEPVTGEPASNGFTRYFATVTITGDASTGTDLACLNINLPAGQTVGAVSYAGAQLECGPVATAFEHRPIGLELSLCQRYYYPEWANAYAYTHRIECGSSTSNSFFTPYPGQVQMRTNPTLIGELRYYENRPGSSNTAVTIKGIQNRPQGVIILFEPISTNSAVRIFRNVPAFDAEL